MPASDPMAFANTVGQELWQRLAQRGQAELSDLTNVARFTALLSAALIPVAEVLRGPIEVSRDRAAMVEKLLPIAERQVRELLRDSIGGA